MADDEPTTRSRPLPAESSDAAGASARSSAPLVRGFLFADLRGYTAYVERAGDAAAVELLERYRVLVRGVIAGHDGAEIRTEGDSFYVVFPSPSAAVRAGLGIVEAAAADAADHPDHPIAVGVGIHAGESAETAEGYVGSAVNLAARICSLAGPGEVLVSETVRSLVRTSLEVSFEPRGRRSLKGVSEPVELFAVRLADGPAATRSAIGRRGQVPRLAFAAVGVAAIALVAGGALAVAGGMLDGGSARAPEPMASSAASPSTGAGSGGASPATSSPTSDASPAGPADLRLGALEPGTYRTALFSPSLELTVPSGWSGMNERINVVALGPIEDLDFDLNFAGQRLILLRPDIVYGDCQLTTSIFEPRPPVTALREGREPFLDWLLGFATLDLGEPRQSAPGTIPETTYDVRLSDRCEGADRASRMVFNLFYDEAAARRPVEEQRLFPRRLHENYGVRPEYRETWSIMEIGGRVVLGIVRAPLDEFDDFEPKARAVLSTLRVAD